MIQQDEEFDFQNKSEKLLNQKLYFGSKLKV
jgi:hypothetical protein